VDGARAAGSGGLEGGHRKGEDCRSGRIRRVSPGGLAKGGGSQDQVQEKVADVVRQGVRCIGRGVY